MRSHNQSFWQVRRHFSPTPPTLPTQSRIRWILPDHLAIGGLPRPGFGAVLLQASIKAVLSLSAPSEGALPEDITQNFCCLRFILPDSHFLTRLQAKQLENVADLIHECIQSHVPLYVHCRAGIERAPLACIAYLHRHQHLALWQAINHVKQVYPRALPTDRQLQVVKELSFF